MNPQDSEYIQKVQEAMIPRGSSKPHPADWKGNNKRYFIKDNPAEKVFYSKETTGRRPRKQQLTGKQLATAQYMLEGYSLRQARLKAGYSTSYAEKTGLAVQKTLKNYLDSIKEKFARKGLNDEYMAEKFKEWMEAKKVVSAKILVLGGGEKGATSQTDDFIEVPDYDTQIKAYDRYDKIVNEHPKGGGGAKKRELTITEFITGDDPPTE